MKRAHFILLALTTLNSTAGCGTVLGRTAAKTPEHFVGTKLDAGTIAGGISGDLALLALTIPAIVDLPLSVVADSVLFAFEGTQEVVLSDANMAEQNGGGDARSCSRPTP